MKSRYKKRDILLTYFVVNKHTYLIGTETVSIPFNDRLVLQIKGPD